MKSDKKVISLSCIFLLVDFQSTAPANTSFESSPAITKETQNTMFPRLNKVEDRITSYNDVVIYGVAFVLVLPYMFICLFSLLQIKQLSAKANNEMRKHDVFEKN